MKRHDLERSIFNTGHKNNNTIEEESSRIDGTPSPMKFPLTLKTTEAGMQTEPAETLSREVQTDLIAVHNSLDIKQANSKGQRQQSSDTFKTDEDMRHYDLVDQRRKRSKNRRTTDLADLQYKRSHTSLTEAQENRQKRQETVRAHEIMSGKKYLPEQKPQAG